VLARDADAAAEVVVQHLTQTAAALNADSRPA
jgi:DNA-binding GntR family transcriptional regulator